MSRQSGGEALYPHNPENKTLHSGALNKGFYILTIYQDGTLEFYISFFNLKQVLTIYHHRLFEVKKDFKNKPPK